jgi:site-specific recombinase XerD
MVNLEIIYEKIKKTALRRGLSIKTVETYCNAIKMFSRWYEKYGDDKRELFFVKKSEISMYLDYLVSKKVSQSTINISYAAIRFLLTQVYNRQLNITEKYSKVKKKLPEYLTQEEMRLFDDFARKLNVKHKLLLLLLYGAGLRVSEVLNLKVSDIDLEHHHGMVYNGKGGKDRVFIIPNILVDDLKKYICDNCLSDNDYMFFQYENKRQNLSAHTVSNLVKLVCKRAQIKKSVHPHTLRHSFATHVVENGHPLWDLSKLLGHDSLQTTMVYTHVGKNNIANVKSPLDELYNKII